ncbi:hypothetical protein [Legionella sp. 29fVS95]|uniref:hypothetical protein n=1 Tax=Legionella sp. 29fVS95 TaxID=3402813 RepID=UPI003AF9C7BE
MNKTSKNPQPHAVDRKNKNQGTEKKSALAGSELEKPNNKSHLNRDPMKKRLFFTDDPPKLEKKVDNYDEENDGF